LDELHIVGQRGEEPTPIEDFEPHAEASKGSHSMENGEVEHLVVVNKTSHEHENRSKVQANRC